MTLKTLLKTSSVSAVALAVGLSSFAAQAENWRYAHAEFEDDVMDVFAYEFKDYVENNSDHTVQIFRAGEIGSEEDVMEQTQRGIIQFFSQSTGVTGSLIPEAQIFFIPYLLPTDEDAVINFFRESTAINEMFPEIFAEQGLELLQMYPEGEMVVTTNDPDVSSPEDLEGKNIRTMTNPLLAETYEAFGASPTPLPWGEVYGGLQTGIIDGQENPIFWIESAGLYEVSPHLVYTGHGWFTANLVANGDFYDSLSPEDKELVDAAKTHAFDSTMEHISGLAEEALESILASSDEVTVTRLTDEQIDAFRERAPQVEERFLEMTGDRGEELLQQFKADLEAQ